MTAIPPRTLLQVRIDLLESIALGQSALAHLIDAQAALAENLARHLPPPSTLEEALEMQRSIQAALQTAQSNERVLLQKLRAALQIPQ